MEKRLIKKDALAGIPKKIRENFTVFAPVKVEDNVVFKELEPQEEPLVGHYQNTKNAPKGVFFPRTEVMMRYVRTPKGVQLKGIEMAAADAVLFGVRPCDARSFALLDLLFDQEKYKDPYYIAKREKATVVTLACARVPYRTCFCTSVEGGPLDGKGSDVLITDLGTDFLVEFLTPKGEKLGSYFEGTPASEEAEKKKEEVKQKAEGEIVSHIPAREIKPILDVNFDHPFWDTIHKKCLACGTCTYLCPTCHCFDISDEMKYDDGRRLRNWDSCMYPLFTKETSGHNPRPTQKERWRQRTMHKFKYYVDNFNAIACVGCGRCVMYCPVNIDIRKIVEDISKLQ
ncbi:MAG: 4Fe-4S dicluster domain-containing protein [Syntrophales bacterium]|nr:4Fe-4S dicluster domain-containing protein [Syntrophales bacterium]